MEHPLARFTDDPVEQEILGSQRIEPLDPDCLYDVRTNILLKNVNAIQTKLKFKHQQWLRELLSGSTPATVAKNHDVTPQSVYNVLRKPKAQEFLHLIAQLKALEGGPTDAQRLDMLWRIAKREELDNPKTAIQALDVINRQKGVYRPDDTKSEGPLKITVNQFVMDANKTARISNKTNVIEGEFTPVTVETDK
jgi:hypothetical protein